MASIQNDESRLRQSAEERFLRTLVDVRRQRRATITKALLVAGAGIVVLGLAAAGIHLVW